MLLGGHFFCLFLLILFILFIFSDWLLKMLLALGFFVLAMFLGLRLLRSLFLITTFILGWLRTEFFWFGRIWLSGLKLPIQLNELVTRLCHSFVLLPW